MELNKLRELDDKETDILSKLMVEKGLEGDKNLILSEFFPEFNLEGTYSNYFGDNLWVQLPFYDKIIFPINPVDEKTFREESGITIDQLLELEKQEKICFVNMVANIHYENFNYLDPILEKCNPNFLGRSAFYDQAFWGLARIGSLFSDLNWSRKKKYRKLDKTLRSIPKKILKELPSIKQDLIIKYLDLELNGYRNVLSEIFSIKDVNILLNIFYYFHESLINTPSLAIDGIITVKKNTIESLIHELNNDVDKFPVDIAKTIIKQFNLINISDLGFDQKIAICNESHKARRALFDLEKSVVKMESDKIIDRAEALILTWDEINRSIESMTVTKNKLKLGVAISLGISGSIAGSLAGLPGLLTGSILGVLTSLPLADPISDSIIKMKKPAHLVSLFDLNTGPNS